MEDRQGFGPSMPAALKPSSCGGDVQRGTDWALKKQGNRVTMGKREDREADCLWSSL